MSMTSIVEGTGPRVPATRRVRDEESGERVPPEHTVLGRSASIMEAFNGTQAGAEPGRPEQADPAAEVDPAPPGRPALPGRLAGTRPRRLPRRPADVRARHARGGGEPAARSRLPAPAGARVAHRPGRAARHPRPRRGGLPGTDRGGPDPAAHQARRPQARLLHRARQGDGGLRRRRLPRDDRRPDAAQDGAHDHRAGRPVGRAQAGTRSRGGVRPRRGLRGAGMRRRADPQLRSGDRGGVGDRAGRPDALERGDRGGARHRRGDLERQPQRAGPVPARR